MALSHFLSWFESGIRTANTLPSTDAVPPWARATASTRARPRPAPSPVRASSARLKRSKACGTNAAGGPGALVRDPEHDAVAVALRAHPHGPLPVPERVVDEVAERLLEPQAVGVDDETVLGLDLQPPSLRRRDRREPRRDRVEERACRDRLARQRQLAAAGRREHEQVVREPHEPVGVGRGRGERRAQLLGLARPPQRDLELGPEQRERRPQLVARVRDEAALALDPGVEAVEHPVQRPREARDLVVGGGHRQALPARLGRDLVRAPPHRLHRAQRRGREAVAGERGEEQRERPGDQQLRPERRHGLVPVAERDPGDEHASFRRAGEQADALVDESGNAAPLDLELAASCSRELRLVEQRPRRRAPRPRARPRRAARSCRPPRPRAASSPRARSVSSSCSSSVERSRRSRNDPGAR